MADHGPAVGMGSSSPDIMNDPAYQTNPTGEGKAPGEGDTCRICRSEGTPEEPLFYPCKCSGSIKFVHQDCLMEWLSHSNKKHCELCKTPFRFTKLYDSHMPDTLPTRVFIRKAFVHILRYLTTWARGGLVGLIWLIALPWCIRWAWRGLFWFTDAGWARDPFVARMEAAALQNASSNSLPDAFMGHAGSQPSSGHALGNSTAEPFTFSLVKMTIHLLLATGRWSSRNAPDQTAARLSPMAYSSILSDVDSVNDLTSSPLLNRMILDVMEGQIITLLVVVAFILVFLIREWVVQQQPILNAAAHAREDEVRIEELHDQAERLRNARNVIEQLAEAAREQNTGETAGSENDNDRTDISSAADFVGWDRLETYVLTQHQLAEAQTDRPHGDIEPEHVETAARDLARQLELVIDSGMEPGEAVRKIGNIIGKMPLQAQRIWLSALREHVQRQKLVFDAGSLTPTGEGSSSGANAEEPVVAEEGEGGEGVASHFGSFRVSARPSMRPREASSGAVRILQALEEEAGVDSSSTHHSQSDAESEDSWESHDSWQLPTPVSAASEPRSRDRTERLNTEKDKAPQGDHDTDHPNGLTKEGSMQDEGSWENRAAASEPSGVTEREEQSTDNHQPAQISGNEGTEHAEANDSHVGLPWGQAAGNESGEDDSWEDTFSEPSHAGGVAQPTERSEHQETANNPRAPTPPPQPAPPQGILQRMFDWFWADIVQNPAVGEPPVHGDEEIIQDAFEEAVFAPLGGNEEAEPALPEIDAQPGQDPEVLAAAAQAGLDPEAVEDAEDLEGILELIGMQGPLAALFQTAMFCSVLITTTLWAAIAGPYLFGKLALVLIGDPLFFMVMAPLRGITFTADLLLDTVTFVGSWALFWIVQLASSFIAVCIQAVYGQVTWNPLGSLTAPLYGICEKAATRLSGLFEPVAGGAPPGESAILLISIRAHESLQQLKGEVIAILSLLGAGLTSMGEHIQDMTGSTLLREVLLWAGNEVKYCAGHALWLYDQATTVLTHAFKTGKLTMNIEPATVTLDPSLAYWSATDRGLTVLAGYIFLAMVGSLYLLRTEPLFSSTNLQQAEKHFTDFLKQAGGVLKVILIISIEMLVFPLYCGLLLDCALLPLFANATIASRIAFATRSPWLFTFVHWFIGTCYMFHFALFVSMCRRIMRKGVLYFIRDPDDETFHPVRDVLERSVTSQLRKIAFSACVYGALVLFCLGGVVWGIAHVFDGVFPIRWSSPEPIIEFPVDFLVYSFLIPLLVKVVNPSERVEGMYDWWLRKCARCLRLSQFLFGNRQPDEEGHHVRKSWSSLLGLKRGETDAPVIGEDRKLLADDRNTDVYFLRDGRYVRAPASDQVRIPKGHRVFLQVTEDNKRIDGKADQEYGIHGKEDPNFTKVYVPPWFRLRIALFLVGLWAFAATLGVSASVVPMVFGRTLFAITLPSNVQMNDIYAYAAGVYFLGTALFIGLKGRQGLEYVKEKSSALSASAVLQKTAIFIWRAIKCLYVYGFSMVVIPCLIAAVLQLYLIIPLNTYSRHMTADASSPALPSNSTLSTEGLLHNTTTSAVSTPDHSQPLLASHTIHLLQDWTLGFLWARISARLVLIRHDNRPATAFRLIKRHGILNPDARLFTRAIALPTLLLFTLILLGPALLAAVANSFVFSVLLPAESFTHVLRTKVYRYSYPVCAGQVGAVWGIWGVWRGVGRWRGRIRDEVYLVGERLHNFGERRPPREARTMVRRERT